MQSPMRSITPTRKSRWGLLLLRNEVLNGSLLEAHSKGIIPMSNKNPFSLSSLSKNFLLDQPASYGQRFKPQVIPTQMSKRQWLERLLRTCLAPTRTNMRTLTITRFASCIVVDRLRLTTLQRFSATCRSLLNERRRSERKRFSDGSTVSSQKQAKKSFCWPLRRAS